MFQLSASLKCLVCVTPCLSGESQRDQSCSPFTAGLSGHDVAVLRALLAISHNASEDFTLRLKRHFGFRFMGGACSGMHGCIAVRTRTCQRPPASPFVRPLVPSATAAAHCSTVCRTCVRGKASSHYLTTYLTDAAALGPLLCFTVQKVIERDKICLTSLCSCTLGSRREVVVLVYSTVNAPLKHFGSWVMAAVEALPCKLTFDA